MCGLVAIAKAGNGYQCGVKKKAAQESWRKRNPGKSAADRRRRSEHQLFNRDYLKLTAECVRCGPVEMTPWGRGYACGRRAEELRGRQEAAPARPCVECWLIDGDRVYLVNGSCPRCSDPRLNDLGASLRDAEYRAAGLDGVPAGFTVVDLENDDVYAMPEDESVVPGWGRSRVIGSDRPWNEV